MKQTKRPVTPGRVSPTRPVPAAIPRPSYVAKGGRPSGRQVPPLTDPADRERLRRAGQATKRVLDRLGEEIRAGVTTDHLDHVAHEAIIAEGGYPSPLGYRGFPKSICTSVNEVVAHGIPDDRPLEDGDIVNCDVTVYLDGMHGDASRTWCVGGVDDRTRNLVSVTRACLERAIATVGPGSRQRDIGRVIEELATQYGYGVVRELVGHGIGAEFHSWPWIRHYDDPKCKQQLMPGMAFTIEPMITMGDPDVVMWDDRWTIATLDGLPSAQFEHTVLVTEDGVEVLTG